MLALFASAFAALRRHATLALFALALILSAFFAWSSLDARRAAAQLSATLAAQQKIISDADARQSARDAALTQTLAQITALKRSVQTPQQAGAALAQTLPQFIAGSTLPAGQAGGAPLPAPLQFVPQQGLPPVASAQRGTAASGESSAPAGPASTSPSSATAPATSPAPSDFLSSLKSRISNFRLGLPAVALAQAGSPTPSTSSTPSAPPHSPGELPTAPTPVAAQSSAPAAPPVPGSLCIPPADLKPLYDSIEDCQACAAKLTASQSDLADERTKFTAATVQRDAALKAARGTFWTRTARAAKWLAIGAAAGAVLARYH